MVVHDRDGKAAVGRTHTDEKGADRITLRPGTYVIFTQNEFDEQFTETHELRIAAGAITTLGLVPRASPR